MNWQYALCRSQHPHELVKHVNFFLIHCAFYLLPVEMDLTTVVERQRWPEFGHGALFGIESDKAIGQ